MSLGFIGEGGHLLPGEGNVAGVDPLQLLLIDTLQGLGVHPFHAVQEGFFRRHGAQGPSPFHRRRDLQDEPAGPVEEQLLQGHVLPEPEAEAVAEGHLHHRRRRAAPGGGVSRHGLAGAQQPGHPVEELQQGFGLGKAGFIIHGLQQHGLVARRLELVGHDVAHLVRGHGEGHQGGGHVQLLEGAAHRILAADGADAQVHLGFEGSQQGRQGLAPAAGILPGLFKILLEGEVHVLEGGAGGDELAHRFHHGPIGPVIGALLREDGVVAPGHEGAILRVLLLQGDLLDHGLNGGLLVPAAEGHEHGARPDGGIEPLRKPPLGANVQVPGHALHVLPEAAGQGLRLEGRRRGHDMDVLGGAVGIQERPAHVHDGLPVPVHDQPGRFGHLGHRSGLQILFLRQGQEGVHVLLLHHHRHPLLGFADGQLRAVQALIFLGDRVQVDAQPLRQLADGHGHTARAEIVAPLDHPAGGGVAEEPLELPFLGGVPLLDLRPAVLHGVSVMGLAGSRGAADAVPARGPAQEDDHIPGHRPLPAHVLSRSRRDDRADLHALGGVARMIHFIHDPRGQADLVAVGGVARRRGGHDLPLGELAGNGLLNGRRGVRRPGEPHGSVDVGPAGKGVPDGAADAGGRPAEGLDLRGVVVGLVFEQQQPGLLLPVRLHLHLHGAGVDLLALVQLVELARGLQVLHCDGGDVHEADGLGSIQRPPHVQIPVKGLLQQGVLKVHPVDLG